MPVSTYGIIAIVTYDVAVMKLQLPPKVHVKLLYIKVQIVYYAVV